MIPRIADIGRDCNITLLGFGDCKQPLDQGLLDLAARSVYESDDLVAIVNRVLVVAARGCCWENAC